MTHAFPFTPPRGFCGELEIDPLATSRWQYPDDTTAALGYDPRKEARVFLGYLTDEKRMRYLGAPIDDRHLVTIAGARSGKGTSAIIPNLLFYPGAVITNDPKGELARITAERRRALGQQVVIIDPFRDAGIAENQLDAFNPLDIVDPADENAVDEAGLIADALIIQETGSGRHWTVAARNVLHGFIDYVAKQCIGSERTLTHVRSLITLAPDTFEAVLADMAATRGYCAQVANSLAAKSENERSSVLSTLIEQTAFLASPAMNRALGRSTFDMDGLKTRAEGLTVYLCLPARRLRTHSRFLRLLLTVALSRMEAVTNVSITQATASGWPTLFLLDEFPVLGPMEVISGAAGLMAGYGVKLWTILQDISQLQRDYPKDWQTFLGNTGLIQNFGSTDEATCAYISKLCGETETLSPSLPELTEQEHASGKHGLNQSVTVTPLIRPDEVRRFFARSRQAALIAIPGEYPIALHRANYFDPAHAAIFGGRYAA